MEAYYIFIVGVLFLLAISDLIVGVSNDAVNFLNSALGSKAAPFRVIMIIAGIGVLAGAVFSNGMMEVARKGIFNPEQFAFEEIMVLFMAVMLTDILLLDFFNTIALPTSTTVSIVFELLGSAVAVATFKLVRLGEGTHQLADYIHTERAMLIIGGIFISVLIAFTVGMIIMWIVRLAFSFNLTSSSRYWSGLWGGIAITAIGYFLLIKGASGSTLVSDQMLQYIREHTLTIMLISLVGWTLLFQLLALFTRISILKSVVLVGTFALAMAFAGNDMVNFIGVPLAGFESFRAFAASGSTNTGTFMMEALRDPVSTPLYFLVIAGLIMVVTLRFSKKARSVTETEINLGRQNEGQERFASSLLARFIVRRAVELSSGILKITPSRARNFFDSRFNPERGDPSRRNHSAFDLVRASVNLVVASILIAIGTSLKLPLSTTYVTFMVAMGTSLADGAWGRESAVYRITGVLTVIGGWFFTAFIAFSVSFLIAGLIFFGKFPVMLLLIGLSIYILLRTHAFHRKNRSKSEAPETKTTPSSFDLLDTCNLEVRTAILNASKILYLTYDSFFREKYKEMKKRRKESDKLTKEVREMREGIPEKLRKFKETEIDNGHLYVQVVDLMKEMAATLRHIVHPAYEHLNNNHTLDKEQADILQAFNEQTSDFFNFLINIQKNGLYGRMDELERRRDELIEMINQIMLSRIKILKKKQKGVKVSMTYLDMLSETKSLLLHSVQLVEAYRILQNSFSKEAAQKSGDHAASRQ